MKQPTLSALAISLLIAVLVLCTACSSPSKVIKVGLVMPFTGNAATYGQSLLKGAQLGMDEINAKGGVNGKKLEIVTYDDGGNPSSAATGAQKFADQKDISIIVGSALSSSSLAMVPITDKAKLPQLLWSSSSPKLTGISPYVFRMCAQDDKIARDMVVMMHDTLKANKIVSVYPNVDAGKGVNDTVVKEAAARNMTVLESISYLEKDQDFAAVVTKIKELKPDAVALGGNYTDSALLVKQARIAGIKVPMVGNSGLFSSKFIELGGSDVEGTILILNFLTTNPDPRIQEFDNKFKTKYGADPDQYSAIAYDGMYVIAQSAKRAMDKNNGELSREELRAALKATNYRGLVGDTPVTFNDVNNWDRTYVRAVVKNGRFVLYQ
jgi:branched-chain amino acid transport system substrate-binding protein